VPQRFRLCSPAQPLRPFRPSVFPSFRPLHLPARSTRFRPEFLAT
jgi:hypothetical protein